MNCGPDYVKVMQMLSTILLSMGLLYLFWKIDPELGQYSYNKIITKCVFYGSIISWVTLFGPQQERITGQVCQMLLAVYLSVCTVTDVLIYQVYDIMQYMGVLSGCIWILLQDTPIGLGGSLILFVGIQYFILLKKYGKADGMGYCICSLYWAGAGVDIEGYLYHMVISFCLLALIQGIKGNVSRKGNLKKAVALYPYISIGFTAMWIFLFQIHA